MLKAVQWSVNIVIIIIVIIVVVVVFVAYDNYYWVYLSSEHPS